MASSLTNSETVADASTASSTSHSTSRGAAEPHTAHPDNYGAKRTLLLYITLSALMACTALATDIFLPGVPEITAELGSGEELMITSFLLGFALAQLILGPVSDRVGRKIPLSAGMIVFALGAAWCAVADTMPELIIARVLQAVGACTGPMLARAIVRDLYEGTRAAQVLSTLMLIMALAPILGPLMGGFLVVAGGWRWTFWAIAAVALIIFGLILFLPESLPPAKRDSGSILSAFVNYPVLFKNGPFMRYVLCVCFYYISIYAFITNSSTVYITHFGVDPRYYGLLFGMNMIGVMSLTAFNKRWVKSYSLRGILKVATLVATVAGVALATTGVTGVGGLLGVVVTVFFVFGMNGVVAACTNAAALNSVEPAIAGTAAALLGSFQYGSGIISSLLLALSPLNAVESMAVMMFAGTALSALMVWLPSRRRNAR